VVRHNEIFQFCDAKREKRPEAEHERREALKKRCAPLLFLGNAAAVLLSGERRCALSSERPMCA
jgi:hypothetical protein